jgi:antitoxin component YwqK of YwqJK toxin-antitoxin module
MNAQSIANFEGKLINVALTNGSIKKGTIVTVNDEYFMLKAEGEAKARDIIYYDEVKDVTNINTINWDNVLNQHAFVELNDGSKLEGFITPGINNHFYFRLRNVNDEITSIPKDNVKNVVLGKLIGHTEMVMGVVQGWSKGKYLYSLSEIKEEVKTGKEASHEPQEVTRNEVARALSEDEVCHEEKLPMDKLTEYFKNEKSESKYSHFKKWQSAYFNDRKYTMHCYFDTTLTINDKKYFAIFASFNKVQTYRPKLEYNFLIPKQELIMQFNWGKVTCLYNGVEMKDYVKYYSLLFPEDDYNFSLSTEEEFRKIKEVGSLNKKEQDRLSEILSKAEENAVKVSNLLTKIKNFNEEEKKPQDVKEEVIKYHDVNNSPLSDKYTLVKEKYTLVNGKMEGQYTSWHDNGKVFIRTNYKNGEWDGLYEIYNYNGYKVQDCNNKNGKMHGLRNMYRDGKLYDWDFYNEGKCLARGVYPLNDEERLKNIKYIAKKLHSIKNLDRYISTNAYLNLGKVAHDTVGKYVDVFPLFKVSYETARNDISANIIRNKDMFSKNKEQMAIVIQFTDAFVEYSKLNDPSKLTDAFDVKEKIDKFMSKRGYTLENLTQSQNTQVGNLNVSGDTQRHILYRNKPKTVTIVSTYTRNGSEYAVVTDHTDNDKTKTLFTDKIQYLN